MSTKTIFRLCVLLLSMSSYCLSAQSSDFSLLRTVLLSDTSMLDKPIDLNPYLYFSESFSDPVKDWKRWEDDREESIKSNIAVRFRVENLSNGIISRVLYLHDLQRVTIHVLNEKGQRISTSKTGILISPTGQEKLGLIIPARGMSAQTILELPPGISEIQLDIDYWVHRKFVPDIRFYTPKNWEAIVFEEHQKKSWIQGLFFGALLLMAIYHLLIFAQNREAAFFWYSAYILVIAWVLSVELGFFQAFIFENSPKINLLLPYLQIHSHVAFVVYFLFLRSFIDLKKIRPFWDKFLLQFLFFITIVSAAASLIFIHGLDNTYCELTFLRHLIPMIALFFASSYYFIILKAKNKLANLFLIGSAILLVSVVINSVKGMLMTYGFISAPKFESIYITEIAVLIEILIFALALGYRQRLQEQDLQRIQELDALKTKFFANISHEFRTPLTVISGIAESIKGHAEEKDLIRRNSAGLLNLVNQLLDLSKLEAGAMKINLIRADIVNFIKYVTESFYSPAAEKNIRLVFYSEESILEMDFDEMKIQQIINNILSNAVKFTPKKGKVVLHLKKETIGNKEFLQIKVQDTGIGISKKDQANIFNRFFQTDTSSQMRKGEGSGIGLALTKELVELSGGKISVKSIPNKGTEFLILLPILKNESIETAKPKSLNGIFENNGSNAFFEKLIQKSDLNSQPITNHFFSEREEKLLIVEDNPDIVSYLKKLLENRYEIEVTEDGKAGIEKALEIIPDIILSDVMMPKATGYEVCQTLKNDERTSHIPIILLTAKATDDDRIEGISGGADAYLTKPFNKKELFIRLEKTLELRKVLQKKYSDISFTKSNESKPEKASKKPQNTIPDFENEFLKKLITVIEKRLDDPSLGVKDLCRAAGLGNMQVNRKLKALTGKTAALFIRSIRLRKAKELLKNPEFNVSEIAYKVGFSDPSYFTRVFLEEFGMSPRDTRR